LTRAEQLAAPGTPDALRAAIQEARKIESGRALYDQARTQIGTWRDRIERIEDQPILDRARSQAANGDLSGAIETASSIGRDRALHEAAQSDIDTWQSQNQSRQWLQEAYASASSGSANGLANALALASRIPSNSDNYGEAVGQINRWSWALLNQAQSIGNSDPERAIRLAQQIPQSSEAYTSAQQNIQTWQADLDARNAPPLPATESPLPAPAPEDNIDATTNSLESDKPSD
jgi:hypothetical protein